MSLYEVYVDGNKFYDPTISELALIDPRLDLSENSAGEMEFTLPLQHPKYDSFEPLTSTIEVFSEGEWLWEGRITDESHDINNLKTYTVEGALGYLNDSIQPQAVFHDIPLESYIERLLNIHNSMVPDNRKIYLGIITIEDSNDSLYRYTNFKTTLQELKEDIVDNLGGHIRIRKNEGKLYLDILKEYDRTCSQVIRLGENLIDLAPSFDYKKIASFIIPRGARLEDQETYEDGLELLDKRVTIEEVNNGKEYISREDLFEKYNKIWRVVVFDDIHVPENLLKKAEEYLRDGQWGDMVIEAKAIDLNYTSEEFQEFRLGDRVRVKSDIHGIDRYFPITSQSINFNNISENTITLGGIGEPVTITGVTNQITINAEKLDERVKESNRVIQQAVYQATELINQGLNGYVRVSGNEILIMDTDDPETAKHVWRWNMGGLGYSNNGYNGPFETAITMDGTIAGKFLAANSVAAEQIDVNYTSTVEQECNDYTDSKLKNYWTAKETEVQLKTNADSILESVSTTYATKDDMGDVQTWIKSTEQKITEDGIFTTINNGIKGSKYITNTKFSMTKNGLTIQGGGITIKNNEGDEVFYADTSGNLIMTGSYLHYNDNKDLAVAITRNRVDLYAWYMSGDYVGSIGSVRIPDSNSSELGIWSDRTDQILLGIVEDEQAFTIAPIIELGYQNGKTGVLYIKDTITGTFHVGNTWLSYTNGLVTSIDDVHASGKSVILNLGDWRCTFTNGCLTDYS